MNEKQYTILLFIWFMIGYIIITSVLCITTNSIISIIFLLPILIIIIFIARARLLIGVDN